MTYATNAGGDFRDPGLLPDSTMGAVMRMWSRGGEMGALTYVPNLASPGSGAAYWPGDVRADAEALRYLGYPAPTSGLGGVSQANDMAYGTGAWNPEFRAAVKSFQSRVSPAAGVVDGWIGTKTRVALAAAVAAKNAAEAPAPAPAPVIPVIPAPTQPTVKPAQPAQIIPVPSLTLPTLPTPQPAAVQIIDPPDAGGSSAPAERPAWHYAVGFAGLAALGGAVGWALTGGKKTRRRGR